jgi:predicted nucleic acid-binding protein
LKSASVVRAFFDSNVLVYAYSADDSHRRAIAADLVALHTRAGSLVISVQVMMETYSVLTRRKTKAPSEVLATLRLLATNHVVSPDAEVALLALRLCADHQLSTWDSLIVQAALEADCDVLYSEDLQAGRRFGSLHVVNPFLTQAHEPSPSFGPLPVSSRSKAAKATKTAKLTTGQGQARRSR